MPVAVAAVAAIVESIGLAFGPIALTGAAAGYTTGAGLIASGLVYGGASAALSFASAALTRSLAPDAAGGAAAVNSPSVRGNVKQATPAQRIWLGRSRSGGAIYFYKTQKPYLYLGFLYSAQPMTRIDAIRIGDKRVTFPSAEFGEILTPLEEDDLPDYAGHVQACFQSGASADQPVNPLLLQDFPNIGSGFRWPGTAEAVFRFDYGEDFEEFRSLYGNVQIPDVQVEGFGMPHYDPRDPRQRLPENPYDPEDYLDAAATWKASNNAALTQAWWCWYPDGLDVGLSKMDWDAVAAAADRDDEAVTHADDVVQKRYTIDGIVTLDQKPGTVMEAMLIANRGFIRTGRGRIAVMSSRPRTPEFSIGDGDICGAYEFRSYKGRRDLINEVRSSFIAPNRAYQDAEGPVLMRADLQGADGEPLSVTLRSPFTSTHQRMQRLMRAFLLEGRLERAWSGPVSLRFLGIEEGDVVRRDSAYSEENGTYKVQSWAFNDDHSAINLVMTQYDPGIENDWVPADEQPFVVSTINLDA